MRLVSFFFLSATLHAAVLAYPLSSTGRDRNETIRVTILRLESESLGGGGGGSGNPELKFKSNPRFGTRPAAVTKVEAKSESTSPEPQIVAAPEAAMVSDGGGDLISAITARSDNDADPAFVSTSRTTPGDGGGAGGIAAGGNGFGAGSGSGSGNGAGPGSGAGESGSGVTLTQARYRDTPRPEYPDNARRQGREGRVLLRVLVDDQGFSKQVEVNRSSGSDTLDRAAAEAIKRWRFYPARYGDKPIESWLRVPIEFRLDDANPR
jgi:protein TonB